jgi:hypothetical protein
MDYTESNQFMANSLCDLVTNSLDTVPALCNSVDKAENWEKDILDAIYSAHDRWCNSFVLQYVKTNSIVKNGQRALLECVMHFLVSVIQVAIRLPLEIVVSHALGLITNVAHSDLGLFPPTDIHDLTYATKFRATGTPIGEYTLKKLVIARIQQKHPKTKAKNNNRRISPEQIITRVCRVTMECFQNNTLLIDQQVIQHTEDQLLLLKQKIIMYFPRQYVDVSSDWKWVHKLFIFVWNACRRFLVQEIITVFRYNHVIHRDNTSPLVVHMVDTMVELLQACLGVEKSDKQQIYNARVLNHLHV